MRRVPAVARGVRRASLRAAACALVLGVLAGVPAAAGCAGGADAGGTVAPDPLPFGPDLPPPGGADAADGAADAAPSADAGPDDAAPPDAGPAGDAAGDASADDDAAGAADDDAADPPPGPEGKPDEVYLVPPGVAARAHVALASAGPPRAAWVERDGPDAPPRLVTWDLAAPDPPAALAVPNLVDPRGLVLTDGWLFYVDVRYGDPDVFAVRLADGASLPVVTRPGAQDGVTAAGSVAAWRDCRACVPGEPEDAAEVWQRDLAGGAEERLTDDGVEDRAPAFGTLADGTVALAWLAGEATARVEAPGLSVTRALPAPSVALALARGALAFRLVPAIINPDSMIINPDSMLPSDVLVLDLASDALAPLTVHAELEPGLDAGPVAAGARVAWVESLPGQAPLRRLRVATPGAASGAPGSLDLTLDEPGLLAPRLGPAHAAFLAPRDDNGGQLDVWILGLDEAP